MLQIRPFRRADAADVLRLQESADEDLGAAVPEQLCRDVNAHLRA